MLARPPGRPGQRVHAVAWAGETFDLSSPALPVGGCPHPPGGAQRKRVRVSLTALVASFVLILPVELPDKTLFATLVLATRFRPLPVFTGVGLAFALQSLIAVTAGSLLGLLPHYVVTGVVALLFLVGAVVLWRSATTGPEDEELGETPDHPPFWRAAALSFGVLFAAEWGDFSQLATAGLAARYDAPVSVFLGSWAALLVVSALAVFLGRKLADRLPIALIRRVAAALFLVFAVVAVVETVVSVT
jgi:Ca2+/H+ antiporter, TMEM165/GDT1 family